MTKTWMRRTAHRCRICGDVFNFAQSHELWARHFRRHGYERWRLTCPGKTCVGRAEVWAEYDTVRAPLEEQP